MNVSSLCSTLAHHPVVIATVAHTGLADFLRLISTSRADLQHLLLDHGAILFRGFEIRTVSEFQACVEALGGTPFGYIGGNSPRKQVGGDIYTSTEYPANEIISLHNEMSYLPRWPQRIFFYCSAAARSGGQTSLANSRDVLHAIPDQILRKFRDKKIKYIRNFVSGIPLGKTWQNTYSTSDRDEVELILSRQGSVGYWSPSGSLRVETCCEAFTKHPVDGNETWFNQAEQWHPSALNPALRQLFEQLIGKGNMPHECEFEDGEPMDETDLAAIRNALNGNKLLYDWQEGDLLMINNILMMHGREAFTGNRRTLAYLSAT